MVLESGARDERHRLVAAYQGIAFGGARRAARHHGSGQVHELLSRYERGHVLAQALKDGYYLVLLLAAGASPALGRQCLEPVRAKMNREL